MCMVIDSIQQTDDYGTTSHLPRCGSRRGRFAFFTSPDGGSVMMRSGKADTNCTNHARRRVGRWMVLGALLLSMVVGRRVRSRGVNLVSSLPRQLPAPMMPLVRQTSARRSMRPPTRRQSSAQEAGRSDRVLTPHVRQFVTVSDSGSGMYSERSVGGSEEKPCPQEAST